MNGPEHYAEAERLVKAAKQHMSEIASAIQSPEPPSDEEMAYTAANTAAVASLAQVHATLALAAAQAEPLVQQWHGGEDTTVVRAWVQVLK